MTKWAVLRSIQQAAPRYNLPAEQAPERVITTAGADWEPAFVADLDFWNRATLLGVPGLSGDLAGLSGIQRERFKQLNQFYKDWRQFMADAVCEPLTPVRPQNDVSGGGFLPLPIRSGCIPAAGLPPGRWPVHNFVIQAFLLIVPA